MVFQSASGLRSRKVDTKKPLVVYHACELPDLDEVTAINRTATRITTGVEKEEEEEHHLQQALNAVETKSAYIPTPDASFLIPDYERFYFNDYKIPVHYVKCGDPVEDFIGCTYNLDDRDIEWLEQIKQSERFPQNANLDHDNLEKLIYCLERMGNETIIGSYPLLEELPPFLEIEQPALLELFPTFPFVYEWWKKRRYSERNGKQITPQLKTEDLIDGDPYVCFRKRELRAQRKSRRFDTHSGDRIRKLAMDLNSVKEILELVCQRERTRKENIQAEVEIFETRIRVRKLKKMLGILTTNNDVDASPDKSRRRRRDELGLTKIKIPLQKFREAGGDSSPVEPISIEDRIKRRRYIDEKEGWLDFTESPFIQPQLQPSQEGWSSDKTDQGFRLRRRQGRGGRMMIDRSWTRRDFLGNVGIEIVNSSKFDTNLDDPDEDYEELDESPSFVMYRSFNLTPSNEPECRTIMNKPYFPEQINIQPLSQQQRAQLMQNQNQFQIIRPPNTSPGANKKITKIDQKSSLQKKKVVENLDPRTAVVRAMMQQSQKQAQTQQFPSPVTRSDTPPANSPSSPSKAFNRPVRPANGSSFNLTPQQMQQLYQQQQLMAIANNPRLRMNSSMPMMQYPFQMPMINVSNPSNEDETCSNTSNIVEEKLKA